MLSGLDKICDSANQAMVEAGVLPDYKGYGSERTERKLNSVDEGKRESQSDPGGRGAGKHHVDSQSIVNQLLDQLQPHTIAQSSGRGSMLSVDGHGSAVASGTNDEPLTGQAMHGVGAWPVVQSVVGISEQTSLNSNDAEQNLVNLVAMLFDFILNDRNLAEPMKVLISRLQIPMVRLGLNDSASLSKRSHPAWKLLNELSVAALNWEINNEPAEDSLYCKIRDIVENINDEYDGGLDLFEKLLNEFREFLSLNSHQSQVLEQRTRAKLEKKEEQEKEQEKEQEEAKEKSDKARLMADKVINGYTYGRELPEVTMVLLKSYWSKVLFEKYIEVGSESEVWDKAVLMVKKLVWSAEAKVIIEKNILMYQALPGIYKELCKGLSSINSDPKETAVILSDLDVLYFGKELPLPRETTIEPAAREAITHIVNQTTQAEIEEGSQIPTGRQEIIDRPNDVTSEVSDPAVAADALNSREVTVGNVDTVAEECLDELAEQEGISRDAFLKADGLKVGTWVRFSSANNQSILCKLALKLKIKTKHIFVDHRGLKVTEKNRIELAHEIDSGQCEIFDDDELFNTALNSVLSDLSRSAEKRGHPPRK